MLANRSNSGAVVSPVLAYPDVNAAAAWLCEITQEPATQPYGERQYGALDPTGHAWTFSQSVEDVSPEAWGGVAEEL